MKLTEGDYVLKRSAFKNPSDPALVLAPAWRIERACSSHEGCFIGTCSVFEIHTSKEDVVAATIGGKPNEEYRRLVDANRKWAHDLIEGSRFL